MDRSNNHHHLPPLQVGGDFGFPLQPLRTSLPSINELRSSGRIPDIPIASSHHARTHQVSHPQLRSPSPAQPHNHSYAHRQSKPHPHMNAMVSSPQSSDGRPRSNSTWVPRSSTSPSSPRNSSSPAEPPSIRGPSPLHTDRSGVRGRESPLASSSSVTRSGASSSRRTNTYAGTKRKYPERKTSIPAPVTTDVPSPEAPEARTSRFGFRCRFCGADFDSRIQRKEHLQQKHPRPFACTECPSRFSRKFDYEKHFLTVHQRIRPFKCGQCPSVFGQKHHLLRHNNSVHLKAKEFKCDHCVAKFARKEHLQNHLKSMHGYFDFECKLCGSGYNEKSVALSHVRHDHKVSTANIGTLVISHTDSIACS